MGEQCLTNAGALGVIPEPCLEAIAAGDGREVMKFDEEIEQNMHAYLKSDGDFAHSSSLCLACVIALQSFAILHGAELHKIHAKQGLVFLHEHPENARSWQHEPVN